MNLKQSKINIGQRSLGLGRAAPHQLPREKREFEGVKTPLNLEVDVMVENGCNEEITVGGHTAQPQGILTQLATLPPESLRNPSASEVATLAN